MRWPGVRPTRSLPGSMRPDPVVLAGLAEIAINANPGCLSQEPSGFPGCALSSGGGIDSQLPQRLFKHFR